MENKLNQQIIDLRRNIFYKKDYLNRIKDLSWKLKVAEETYSYDSDNPEELKQLIKEYDRIWGDFLYLAQLEIGSTDYVPYTFSSKEE